MTMQNLVERGLPSSMPEHDESSELQEAQEAARYALLQRLAPALQHQLMGKFQSMGMIAAMMDRRFQSEHPDFSSIREDCKSLSSVSRATVDFIVNLMSWIEPKATDSLKLDAGIAECVGLLATKLRFKGFSLVNEVSGMEAEVSARALRSVLSAALIALADQPRPPATFVLRAVPVGDAVELSIEICPTEKPSKPAYASAYRALRRRDVEMLARAESVRLAFGISSVKMVFPCVASSAQLTG